MPAAEPALGTAEAAALFRPLEGLSTIALAVSGGPDSLALMLCAARWAETRPAPPRLLVLSVDHGLRPEAAAEVQWVVEQAARLGLDAKALRWAGGKPQTGVQATARSARYELMAGEMAERGISTLLTAHHLNDQAETLLMRMAHGSGLNGLGGMRPLSSQYGITLFRPFLATPQVRLHEIVKASGLVPISDPSNADLDYERVRWRAEVPHLGALGLTAASLAKLARRVARAELALSEIAARRFTRQATFGTLGEISFPHAVWSAEPEEIRLRLLGTAVEIAGGGTYSDDLARLEELSDSLVGAKAQKGTTFRGAKIYSDGRVISVVREASRVPANTVTLARETSLLWDNRFAIHTGPECRPVTVTGGHGLRSAEVEKALGMRLNGRAYALAGSPLVTDQDGEILAVGANVISRGLTIRFGTAETDRSNGLTP